MAGAFETTMDFFVKSRPVVSLGEWHSTQYLVKKAWAQLFHVSPALPSLVPESAPPPADSFEPPCVEEPDEQPTAHRITTVRARAFIGPILQKSESRSRTPQRAGRVSV
jgi:hypothetical protein